ncbi:MAG: DnaJ domain-containing protein [Acidobacteria bacterium]|nr:DnaJ domain-containing protein [Acidobacteriota bacterium]
MNTPRSGFRGSLAETPLPQVLRRIFLEGLKGTLTLVRGDETRHLFFEKGELRTATSSREGQRIGAFLKRRGWITDEDLSWALETVAKQGRARLGKILVEKGLVSRQVLDAEMRRLVEEIVFSTFEWDQGEYRFQSSTGVLDPDVALTLSTAAIIVEGIRRLPENDTFQKRLGDGHAVPSLARDPMSRYQYLPLTPQEAYLLSRIDGVLDLESLLKIGGGSRGSAAKTLYALFSCGIVEWKTEGTATGHAGGFEGLNVVVDAQPPDGAPGHAELVKNTYRRIDWLTHYELLGVASTATTEQIGKAYFERSRLFHPDLRHRGDLRQFERELAAVFERLKTAHDVLSDADRRREYDDSLDAAPVPVAVAETSANPEVRRNLAEQSYRRARELIAQKDFHPAVEMMREAIRFVPDNAEYRMCLGQVELRNALWIPKGLENLKEAARLEPRRVPFIRTAARALHEHGRNDEAEPFARRLVDLDPSPENQELLSSILAGAVPARFEDEPDADPLEILDSPTSPDEVTLERSAAALARGHEERPGLLSRIFRSRN